VGKRHRQDDVLVVVVALIRREGVVPPVVRVKHALDANYLVHRAGIYRGVASHAPLMWILCAVDCAWKIEEDLLAGEEFSCRSILNIS